MGRSDTIGPEGLVFEYRLTPGPATTRNAITLLDLHGAPDSLVQRALTRAAALDQQRRRAKALS
jgi:DNA mismatch repair ATPase MutS